MYVDIKGLQIRAPHIRGPITFRSDFLFSFFFFFPSIFLLCGKKKTAVITSLVDTLSLLDSDLLFFISLFNFGIILTTAKMSQKQYATYNDVRIPAY